MKKYLKEGDATATAYEDFAPPQTSWAGGEVLVGGGGGVAVLEVLVHLCPHLLSYNGQHTGLLEFVEIYNPPN